MDVKQQNLVELDSYPKKTEDIEAFLSLAETPEQKKKKPRSVGFYELDLLKPSDRDGATEDDTSAKSLDLKDKDEDATNGCSHQDGDPSPRAEDQCPDYLDQSLPTSSGHHTKHSNQTCLCKECVENYMNLCEYVQEPNVVGLEKKDDDLLSADRVSLNSNKSLEGFEASRHTDSSEDDKEESMGTRYEDSEVTLPYPDKSRPPECITRLSNAGLYEPTEDASEKKGDEEEKISSVAFFVEHPPSEMRLQSALNKEPPDCSVKVEIEKAEPELEPLIRAPRRVADEEPVHPVLCRCHGACLKIIGSFVVAMLVFPAFLYAAYAWLPFDAPIMADIPTRLVYTLRCASFGSVPIVMGVVIHGISRLCVSSFDPFKPREREVTIHRRFVKQSTFLFVLYFFNLSVLVTYLPQGQLKFIPLLTCLFCLAQLIYWLSFAVGRSFRGFGFGLTFLPLVSMLICNLYFMFVVEPERMVFLGGRDTNRH